MQATNDARLANETPPTDKTPQVKYYCPPLRMPCTTYKRRRCVQGRPAQTHPDDKQLAPALEAVNAFNPESILMVKKGAVPTAAIAANDAKIASDGPHAPAVTIHSTATRTDASPVQANEKTQGRRLAMLLSGNLTWAEHKDVYNLFARKKITANDRIHHPRRRGTQVVVRVDVGPTDNLQAVITNNPNALIVLADGIYQPGSELLVAHSVTLRAANTGMAILDGQNAHRLMWIIDGDVTIEGLVIRNGRVSRPWHFHCRIVRKAPPFPACALRE